MSSHALREGFSFFFFFFFLGLLAMLSADFLALSRRRRSEREAGEREGESIRQ